MIIKRQIVKTEEIELKTGKSSDLLNRIEKQSTNKINDSLLFEIRDSDSKTFFLNVVFQSILKEKNESDKEDNEQQREKLEENNFVSQFVKSSFNSLENDDKEHQEEKQENVETGEVLLYLVVLDNGEFYRLVDSKKIYNDTHEQYISKISSKKMFTEKELERNGFKIFDCESKQLAIKDTNVYFQTNYIYLGIEEFFQKRNQFKISSIESIKDPQDEKERIFINTEHQQFIYQKTFEEVTANVYIEVLESYIKSELETFKKTFLVQDH